MKTSALTLLLVVGFSSCLPNTSLTTNLDLDYNWYCNIWGTLMLEGTIGNNNSQKISAVELRVKTTYSDGTTTTQEITIRNSIASGNTTSFKKSLSNSKGEHPSRISVVVYDAW